MTRLRLRGLRSGGTVLDVTYGEEAILPMEDVGLEREIADRFCEAWRVPGRTSDPRVRVGRVAGRRQRSGALGRPGQIRSLGGVRRGGGEAIVIDTAQTDRAVWRGNLPQHR